MSRLANASLLIIGLLSASAWAGAYCDGWEIPEGTQTVAGCPQLITYKNKKGGAVDVKYLVRSTADKCMFEELKNPSTSTLCGKPAK